MHGVQSELGDVAQTAQPRMVTIGTAKSGISHAWWCQGIQIKLAELGLLGRPAGTVLEGLASGKKVEERETLKFPVSNLCLRQISCL